MTKVLTAFVLPVALTNLASVQNVCEITMSNSNTKYHFWYSILNACILAVVPIKEDPSRPRCVCVPAHFRKENSEENNRRDASGSVTESEKGWIQNAGTNVSWTKIAHEPKSDDHEQIIKTWPTECGRMRRAKTCSRISPAYLPPINFGAYVAKGSFGLL